MKIFRCMRFVNELIHYIFYVSDNADDDMPIEVICRKLYKYGLIDTDDDNIAFGYIVFCEDGVHISVDHGKVHDLPAPVKCQDPFSFFMIGFGK